MSQLSAIAWVLSLCTDLRKSQAKTLADLTAAALHLGRVSLAAIGRQLTGPATCKHRIKRTWRFCANQRVVIADAMRGLVRHLLKRRRAKPGKYRRKPKPLLIALDWTDIRNFHTLMAAAVMKGRAVPLLWATYTKWKLAKSQNNLEEGLLWLLRDLMPPGVPVILLADRGFGRTELAKVCRQLDFRYVVRIKPDVWVEGPQYCGLLQKYPVTKGMAVVWQGVRYRKDDPVRQHDENRDGMDVPANGPLCRLRQQTRTPGRSHSGQGNLCGPVRCRFYREHDPPLPPVQRGAETLSRIRWPHVPYRRGRAHVDHAGNPPAYLDRLHPDVPLVRLDHERHPHARGVGDGALAGQGRASGLRHRKR
jgi:hypothetical protein